MQASTGERPQAFTVLGIETSCDETAAAVVRGLPPGPGQVLSNVVFSQIDDHSAYGGVVPEIAARAHVEMLEGVIERSLDEAEMGLADLDAVAATAGPGLIGGVMVGLTTAKAIALASDHTLLGINHLEAHALTVRLTHGIAFPFLLLLVSGGHCQLLAVEGADRYSLYGTTIDDAAGEAFDKVAKLLRLGYPGGPAVERSAREGDRRAVPLPRPMLGREGCDFSFAGLKTAVRRAAGSRKYSSPDMAASFQQAALDVIADRTRNALRRFRHEFAREQRVLVLAGGVAANIALRDSLARLSASEGFTLSVPPPSLCTDNAAMIAWAGIERLHLGQSDDLSLSPLARWPLGARQGTSANQ